jgi:hypothetical protein
VRRRRVADVGDRRPPVRGGGGMPHRIMASSRSVSVLRMTGAGKSGNTPVIGGRLPT